MLKTLFSKYLSITSLIIVVSFVFLGTVMIVFISRYWQTEKRDQLKQNAQGVASIASTSVVKMDNNEYVLDSQNAAKMNAFIAAFSDNLSADLIVTDVKGIPILYHYVSSSDLPADTPVSPEIMQEVLNGQYNQMSSLNGRYNHNCYAVGIPITVKNDAG